MKKQTKKEADSLLRVPKPSKFGLKITPIAMPHDDLIKAEQPKLELVEKDSSTSMSSITSSSSQSSSTSKARETEISPSKNYQKVPNSVSQNLDLFKGKSKAVWDFLWLKTRAAINPTRTVQLSRAEIKAGAALGSFVTVDAAIEHLSRVGLLKVTKSIGSLKGNEYEIFTPEEIDLTSTSSTSISSTPSLTQKVDILAIPESSYTRETQTEENKGSSGDAKTLIKTNTSDDEPFGAMLQVFEKMCEKATGKKPGKSDAGKWTEFAELIEMEFEIAFARTKSVSDVPAFLTEHLRRRLLRNEPPKVKTRKTIQTGDSPAITIPSYEYEAEPLTAAARLTVLETMRGYVKKGQKEFVYSLHETYTAEDWKFLIKELEK